MYSLYQKQWRISIIVYFKLYLKLKLLLIEKTKNFSIVNKQTLKFLPRKESYNTVYDHKINFTLLTHNISYILELEKKYEIKIRKENAVQALREKVEFMTT